MIAAGLYGNRPFLLRLSMDVFKENKNFLILSNSSRESFRGYSLPNDEDASQK